MLAAGFGAAVFLAVQSCDTAFAYYGCETPTAKAATKAIDSRNRPRGRGRSSRLGDWLPAWRGAFLCLQSASQTSIA